MTDEHQYLLALRLLEAEHKQPLTWLRQLAPTLADFEQESQH
ncbi:MAG: hypothetical protein RJA97_252, partial [Bacteroidota bacterium]